MAYNNRELTAARQAAERGENAPPRVAITGITGYVGRELARAFADSGSEVLGLTRQNLSATLKLPRSVQLRQIGDHTETLCENFERFRPDVVIHLASLARRNHLVTDITPFFEANILLGARLLEAMRVCGCFRFVTAESILQFSVGGASRATNLYAATKHAFAEILLYYTSAFGISAIALVLPTLYSEQETRAKLMTDVAAAVLNGTPLNLQAEAIEIDFVHIEDVARAFIRASGILMDAPVLSGTLSRYWIGSGVSVTPLELVAMFERFSEKKIDVRWQHTNVNSRRPRPWSGPVLPGWVPQIDLETGIRKMLSTPR